MHLRIADCFGDEAAVVDAIFVRLGSGFFVSSDGCFECFGEDAWVEFDGCHELGHEVVDGLVGLVDGLVDDELTAFWVVFEQVLFEVHISAVCFEESVAFIILGQYPAHIGPVVET